MWRNWQTHKTQNLAVVTSCGFKSRHPHSQKDTEKQQSFLFLSVFLCIVKIGLPIYRKYVKDFDIRQSYGKQLDIHFVVEKKAKKGYSIKKKSNKKRDRKLEKKLVLIDGNSIINRAFYGVPELTNREGLHTNAIY